MFYQSLLIDTNNFYHFLQAYPTTQMQTQYMQQGYYPYAYTTSAQQAGGVRMYHFPHP